MVIWNNNKQYKYNNRQYMKPRNEPVLAKDILEGKEWELINVLINQNGYCKVKANRYPFPIPGELNYASAWIKTDVAQTIYKDATGKDLIEFAKRSPMENKMVLHNVRNYEVKKYIGKFYEELNNEQLEEVKEFFNS